MSHNPDLEIVNLDALCPDGLEVDSREYRAWRDDVARVMVKVYRELGPTAFPLYLKKVEAKAYESRQ